MENAKKSKVLTLVECALLVALATVLSLLKVVELPYGGSITLASMLPIIIIAYRNGTIWGAGSALVFSVIQQLLGLNNLSYVTGPVAIIAVIMLDYIVAFTVLGLGGVFRKKCKQPVAIALGALLTCILRFVCHIISGCTVWAGLSIPTSAALIYSIGYNGTYMIPETIITVVLGYYLASVLDFTQVLPKRLVRAEETSKTSIVLNVVSYTLGTVALVFDTIWIFARLQNPDTGDFDITPIFSEGAGNVWLVFAIVTVVSVAAIVVLQVLRKKTVQTVNPAK